MLCLRTTQSAESWLDRIKPRIDFWGSSALNAFATCTIPLVTVAAFAFVVAVGLAERRALYAHLTAESIEGLLRVKPWYVARFSLIAWEYLMIEAGIVGLDEDARHRELRIDTILGGGPWHWRLRRLAAGSPLARWLGAPLIMLMGVAALLVGFHNWGYSKTLLSPFLIFPVFLFALAVESIAKGGSDRRLGRRLWTLRDVSSEERLSSLVSWARENVSAHPDLYTSDGSVARTDDSDW